MPVIRHSRMRRSILQAGLGLAALPASPGLWAKERPESRVWLDMTQSELDDAYSQGKWAPNGLDVWARYSISSEAAIARLGEPRCFEYGDSPDESLEVHTGKGSALPIHIFVHGGAWYAGTAREYAFLAETFVNAGAHFVALNFSSVHDTDGNLARLADQVRRAIAWVYRGAGEFDGDASRIYLSGHSSGAHLAGVALTTDWEGGFDLPMDVVKGGLCCSGMFDLEPVSLSARNKYLRFDSKSIRELSPQRNIDRLRAPLLIACGSLESPEFLRQSREFSAAVRSSGREVELIVGEHYNHFEIIETLANPYGLLGHAALGQMGLA